MYDNGDGVPQDDKEAVKWYEKAAVQGLAEAQFNLGVMYANGEGVPEDMVTAYLWWNLAGAQGHENGLKGRDVAKKEITTEQIAEGQRRSRKCLESNYQDC